MNELASPGMRLGLNPLDTIALPDQLDRDRQWMRQAAVGTWDRVSVAHALAADMPRLDGHRSRIARGGDRARGEAVSHAAPVRGLEPA